MPLTSVHTLTGCFQPVYMSLPKWAPTRRYSDPDIEHAELDIDPATRAA
jgi:hypothetical protein